jgi:hypothetical protein
MGDVAMRYSQSVLRALTAAALAAPLVAGSIVGSLSPAAAAVYSPQQALPAPTIQQFLANPNGLLSQFPNGGPDLAKMVRDLAASDPQTLSALIGLLRGANPSQASAIGTGLGQTAELAVNTDPAYATEIQTAVVTASNDSAMVAFSAVVGGDVKLAAAGGGGGGGGGEEQTNQNSVGGGFSGPSNLNFPSFVNNTADSFLSPSFTPGTPGTPSVSPTTP